MVTLKVACNLIQKQKVSNVGKAYCGLSTAMIGELQQTDKEIEEGEFNVNNITSLNNIFTFHNTDGGIVDLYTSYSKPVIYITVHVVIMLLVMSKNPD